MELFFFLFFFTCVAPLLDRDISIPQYNPTNPHTYISIDGYYFYYPYAPLYYDTYNYNNNSLGHYTFRECGNVVNPKLGLVAGQNYTFLQSDRTNYLHPIDIGLSNGGVNGMTTTTMITYWRGSTQLDRTAYGQAFQQAPHLWWSPLHDDDDNHDDDEHDTTYAVKVHIPETAASDALTIATYYYCIIHYGMEGPLQIVATVPPPPPPPSGVTVTDNNNAAVLASLEISSDFVDVRSTFDQQCGSSGLDSYRLSSDNTLCPARFICGQDTVSAELREFASCLEAANCAMFQGMTTGVKATEDTALFVHQMIPHHENAVNTAKTLLKTGNLLCPDLRDQTNPDCILEAILLEIVAGQNHQIQQMKQFLQARQYPQTDNCNVHVVATLENDVDVDGAVANGVSTKEQQQQQDAQDSSGAFSSLPLFQFFSTTTTMALLVIVPLFLVV